MYHWAARPPKGLKLDVDNRSVCRKVHSDGVRKVSGTDDWMSDRVGTEWTYDSGCVG